MKENVFAPVLLGLLLAVAPLASRAQGTIGFTATEAPLRAGPADDYPVVAVLAGGVQVAVQGCVPDYTWCDVIVGPSRGWLYAGSISYPYQGSAVPLLSYGAFAGVGVLGFVLNDYWRDHYRARPWYPDRYRWANRPHVRVGPPAERGDRREHGERSDRGDRGEGGRGRRGEGPEHEGRQRH